SAEFDAAMEQMPTSGAHLFYEPATLRLPDFDAVSPFGASKTYLFLAAQLAPGGDGARRNLVQSLAAFDPQTIALGGWMLPIGQEDALRDVLGIYRQLPPVRFATAKSEAPQSQPVVVRHASFEGRS